MYPMLKPATPREISIVYRRLPNDVREFAGILRASTKRRLIIESTISIERPISVSDEVIADTGYLAIWFVYTNRWYDTGKFYDQRGRWIGYYCDIIKPVKKLLIDPSRTVTLTDIFLDLWITRDGRAFILDEDELHNALENHLVSSRLAHEAERRIRSLYRRATARRFPPMEVRAIEPLATLT
jgi:predicted RNA-binding protein associated with RNAse of E/G family